MFREIFAFAMGIFGIVSLLLTFVFKIISYRIENITISLPLKNSDKAIHEKIYNIYSILDFCGLKNKCTIVLVNYDAPEWFCKEIKEYYKNYSEIKIIDCCDNASKLF